MTAIVNMLADWCARWVEEGFAVGRAMGYTFPHRYAFGFKILTRSGNDFRVRLRIDDTTCDALLRFPTGNEPSIAGYDRAIKLAQSYANSATLAAIGAYIDAHPNVMPVDKAKAFLLNIEAIERKLDGLPTPTFTVVR